MQNHHVIRREAFGDFRFEAIGLANRNALASRFAADNPVGVPEAGVPEEDARGDFNDVVGRGHHDAGFDAEAVTERRAVRRWSAKVRNDVDPLFFDSQRRHF